MDDQRVPQKLIDLGWEATLPAPDDCHEHRQQKRENLLRALEVRRSARMLCCVYLKARNRAC